MADYENTYTVKEVCEILHKNSRTIYAYIRSGQLKAYRPGNKSFLITESALNEFMNSGVKAGYYQQLYPRPHKRDKVTQSE